ncbi:unnamed protein product [Callosobruchus maculatus]|uniref:Uncharacterized protein n=1 Tax=Callosobruchus maculatus TaxID=64391 RepID=A0A653BLS1_CALMS|nr:unnamed protein product [Callosobruchus maculatus]
MSDTFKGKVVLITGGSSGIGAETAIEFSSLGADVVITGRNAESLEQVADKCLKKPLIIQGDVTKEKDVEDLMSKVIQTYGKLDVLVNNAGIIGTGGIESTSLAQFDNMFQVNVRSLYHLTMLATPYLIKTKGNIINVSSRAGLRAANNVLAYCMSKSAVDQFTRCCALDLAAKGVRVNSVNPGVIVTELHKRGGMSEEEYAKFLERCKQTHPLGRPGQTTEVAKAIVFLASDGASFITGVNLPIDGGSQVACPR